MCILEHTRIGCILFVRVCSQVKTYRDGLQTSSFFKIFCIIVTFSNPPEDVVNLLEHEGISVLTLTEIIRDKEAIDELMDTPIDPYLMK